MFYDYLLFLSLLSCPNIDIIKREGEGMARRGAPGRPVSPLH